MERTLRAPGRGGEGFAVDGRRSVAATNATSAAAPSSSSRREEKAAGAVGNTEGRYTGGAPYLQGK